MHKGVAWLSAGLALLSIISNTSAKLDPSRTPPMGWRSWCVSEFLLLAAEIHVHLMEYSVLMRC